MPNPILEAARAYRAMGLHPIPCEPRGKRPLVEWKPYQDEPPHPDEIEAWWAETPDANVGLVMGRGIFAVDFDGGADAEALLERRGVRLPPGPRSRTGKGYHVFLATQGRVADRVRLAWDGRQAQVDVRGIGFVVVPPSVHPTGAVYAWEIPLTLPLPAAPPELLALLQVKPEPVASAPPNGPREGAGWVSEALRGVSEGMRDQSCTRLAGYFLGKGVDAATTEALLLQSFARNCVPAFPAEDVRKCVHSIAARHGSTNGQLAEVVPVKLSAVLSSLETDLRAGIVPKAVQTGFPGLTRMLDGGFCPGELAFIAASAGTGKTAFALELARAAAKGGDGVLVISREMKVVALARRLLGQEARVGVSRIKRANLGAGEWVLVDGALQRLRSLPIWLTDAAVTLPQIRAAVDQAPSPFALLIVDYLQLVRVPGAESEKRHQVEAAAQGLKEIAMSAGIPVVLLSSIARLPGGPDSEPTKQSLRESGELEHTGDIILLLHRKFEARECSCIVAKNRDGREGRVPLLFRKEWTAFEEAENREE